MAEFAKRMDNIKASDIRQLLKIIGQPGIISFAGGLPAPELFPVEDFKAALDAVMDENGRVALQYGATEGWKPLRDHIVKRLAARNNIHTDADHVLLTAGSQQGLDFLGKLYLDPGEASCIWIRAMWSWSRAPAIWAPSTPSSSTSANLSRSPRMKTA